MHSQKLCLLQFGHITAAPACFARYTLILGCFVGAALFFTGCQVGPDYEVVTAATPAGYSESIDEGALVLEGEQAVWWTVFNDPELSRLIAMANAQNYSLKSALKRWEQAEALIRRERADGKPQLGGAGSYSRDHEEDQSNGRGGVTSSTYEASIQADWELDFFGRVSRLVEAAKADAEAEGEALYDLQLIVQTEVARTYFEIQQIETQAAFVRQSIGTRAESLRIVKARFESGTVSELDVAQGQSLLSVAQANLAVLQRQQALARNALALLVGQPASQFSLALTGLEGTPPSLAFGLPSELLRQRPDIREAERRVAAASARIGVAKAAFYPSIILGGGVGFSSGQFTTFGESSSQFWGIGPGITLPFFQGGRLRANLKRSELAYLETIEDYQQVVLASIAEVEDALQSIRFLSEQRLASAEAVDASQRARDISMQQYRNGVIDFITVLDTERTLLESQQRLSEVIGEEYLNTVALIRALGGSW